MDTWIVHLLNLPGSPRVIMTEVQAENIVDAVAAAVTQVGSHQNQVISARLKAPIDIA